MRAHAHLDTRRREPWLFDADKTALIRDAIRMRYELLPLWYTVFYEHYQSGLPVARYCSLSELGSPLTPSLSGPCGWNFPETEIRMP